MSRTGRWNTQATLGLILLVVGVVTGAAVLALTIPAGAPLHPGGSTVSSAPTAGADLGERIFLTGIDAARLRFTAKVMKSPRPQPDQFEDEHVFARDPPISNGRRRTRWTPSSERNARVLNR
jgi:hypothetical protein